MATANPLRRTALAVVAVAVAVFVLSLLMERLTPYTSQATVQAYIVRVAPEVGGRVVVMGVVDNAIVASGQTLFQIDPRPYEIAVEEAEARLASIGQTLGASTAAVDAAQANLVEVRAKRDHVREQAQRVFELVQRGVYPQARYDQAKAALDGAEAALAKAAAELVKAEEELGPAGAENPQFREALAQLERARLDLMRTTVTAPADGVVSNVTLATGQFVAAGQSALTFIDAQTIWVTANLRENSLEHLAAGDAASVVFDSLPGQVFPARVESIGWGVSQGSIDPATGLPTIKSQSGWVREPQLFPTRLVFPEGPPKGLRYGSQANVVIYANDSAVMHAIGRVWIRLVSVLTYLS